MARPYSPPYPSRALASPRADRPLGGPPSRWTRTRPQCRNPARRAQRSGPGPQHGARSASRASGPIAWPSSLQRRALTAGPSCRPCAASRRWLTTAFSKSSISSRRPCLASASCCLRARWRLARRMASARSSRDVMPWSKARMPMSTPCRVRLPMPRRE
eukprot:scaffold562_cov235-Prasinococcus_capsulatus_cf.AAC.4